MQKVKKKQRKWTLLHVFLRRGKRDGAMRLVWYLNTQILGVLLALC